MPNPGRAAREAIAASHRIVGENGQRGFAGTATYAGVGSRSGARHLLDDALGIGQKTGTRRVAGLKGGKTSVRRASQNARVVIAKVQHDVWDSDVAVFDGMGHLQDQPVDSVPLIPPSASTKKYQHFHLFESLQPEDHAQTQGQYGVARGGGLAAARQASKMAGGRAARRLARATTAPFAKHLQLSESGQHVEPGQHVRRQCGPPHEPMESNQVHLDYHQQHRQWASRAGFQPTGARRASGRAVSSAAPCSAFDQSGLSVDQALLDDAFEEQMLEHAIAGYAGGAQRSTRAGARPWSADTFVGGLQESEGLAAAGVSDSFGARANRKAALTASTYKDQSVLRSVTRGHQGTWPRRDGRASEPSGPSGAGNSRGVHVGARSLERASSAAASSTSSSSSSSVAPAKPTRSKSGRSRKSSSMLSANRVHSSHVEDRGRRSAGSTVVHGAHAQAQAHKHPAPESNKPYNYKEQSGYGQPVPSYTAGYLRGYYDDAEAATETSTQRAKSPSGGDQVGGASTDAATTTTAAGVDSATSSRGALSKEASDTAADVEKPLLGGRGSNSALVNADAPESKGKPDSAGSSPPGSRTQPSWSSEALDQHTSPRAAELESEPDYESHEVVCSPTPVRRAREVDAGKMLTTRTRAESGSDGRAETRWSWEREKGVDQCQLLMEAARSLWDGFGLDRDDLVRSIDQHMTLQCTKSSSSLDEPPLRCVPLNLPRTPRNHGELRKSKEKINLKGPVLPGESVENLNGSA